MADRKILAVLTGDIVRSGRLTRSELDAVRSTLLDATDEVKHWQRNLVRGKAEFFRGDAWQVLITDPALALRAGLTLRTALLAQGLADTRISIGLGTVGTISPGRISLSTGEAFVVSGRSLDTLPPSRRFSIATRSADSDLVKWLPVIAGFCDVLLGQLTRRQAELVGLAADPAKPTQAQISERLQDQVSQQAVSKILIGANWATLDEAIRQFESTDWERVLNSPD